MELKIPKIWFNLRNFIENLFLAIDPGEDGN
jgi:hypothetical protein